MPTPQLKFENNDKAAHAISQYLDQLRPSPQRFALRPYNRFSTEFTEWWFIPNTTEWPAYRYSKLFIHRVQPLSEEAARLYTGFYVEKGLGKQLTGMADVQQKHIMQPNWYWHDFIRAAKNGDYDTAIGKVITRSQCPLVISLNVYEFNRVPEPDTERDAPYDAVEFISQAQNGSFQLVQPGTEIMAQLNTCTNIRELTQRLETLKGLEFFWLNLLIGIRLSYGTPQSGTLGATEIWQNALEPWNSWVR